MNDRNNLKQARAYRSSNDNNDWEIEVIFNDGITGKLGATYTSLDNVAIEIKNTNLKEFKVEI